MKRRDFLGYTTALAGAGVASQVLGGIPVSAQTPVGALGSNFEENDSIVIIIQLFGGNDGLNTVIPAGDPYYPQVRPDLYLPTNIAKRVGASDVYLHPALVDNVRIDNRQTNGFLGMIDKGELAVIQNIGYRNPNLSHFRSTDIWLSGLNISDPNVRLTSGWLGRYFSSHLPNFPIEIPDHPLCVQIGGTLSMLFQDPKGDMGIALSDPAKFFELGRGLAPDEDFLNENSAFAEEFNFIRTIALQSDRYSQVVKDAFDKGRNTVNYSSGNFAQQLRLIGRLISGGLKSKVYMAYMGGFDTHVQQQDIQYGGLHPSLLNTLATGVVQFMNDMLQQGMGNRILGLTVSEFGRRIYENGSRGTDHGSISVQFAFGQRVNGGIYGRQPDLKQLFESGQEPEVPEFDYRRVYSEIIQTWFGAPREDADVILDGRFAPIGILQPPITSVRSFDQVAGGGLTKVFPNPSRDFAQLEFSLRVPTSVEVSLYSVSGDRVATAYQGRMDAGSQTVSLPVQSLPAGTYIVEVYTSGGRLTSAVTVDH